jgi:hypothetical protein
VLVIVFITDRGMPADIGGAVHFGDVVSTPEVIGHHCEVLKQRILPLPSQHAAGQVIDAQHATR